MLASYLETAAIASIIDLDLKHLNCLEHLEPTNRLTPKHPPVLTRISMKTNYPQ